MKHIYSITIAVLIAMSLCFSAIGVRTPSQTVAGHEPISHNK